LRTFAAWCRMNKRSEEEYARAAFHELLNELNKWSSIEWEPVAQAQEPPDYFLLLEGRCYAVEVTTIVENITVGTENRTRYGFEEAISRFIKRVEQRARREKVLRGMYAVSLTPLPSFALVKETLEQAMMDYIADTKDMPSAPERELLADESYCRIRKISLRLDSLEEVISFEARWEGDSKRELIGLINTALETKERKLRNIACAKILLLVDGFHYINGQGWREAVDYSSARHAFELICRIANATAEIIWLSEKSTLTSCESS
jgi:hypothetical protein